ncbi:flagellin [Salinibacter ruber]|jgi:flagellin|uniref:flagellin N-terminal helical domain-containing protein n=1 Tax=Salinibacter ruber TaxID=146919 RepID=UPI002073FB0A|nr:flagellin [Salinibacter ruber]
MSTFSQINTNIQAQQAFQNLSDTSEELANRQERLSTGLRINSASDDAAGFQIANQLEARTGGQQQALRNIGDAKSALSTAEGALDTQLSILQSAKEKATQAANGSLSQDERDAIANELKEQVAEINDIAENTTFNGDQLIKGGTSGPNGESVGLTFQTGATSSNTFDVNIGNSTGEALGVDGSNKVTTTDGQTVNAGDFTSTPANVTTLEGNLSVSTSSASSLASGLDGGSFEVTVEEGTTANKVAFKAGGSTFSATGSSSAGSFATNTDVVLEENDAGSKSIAFNTSKVNLNSGSISSGDSKSFTVSVNDTDNLGTRLEGKGGDTARGIIDTVDSAIDDLTSELSNLGASQNRLSFKESNLETSQTNLSAAQSRIEDADFAREQTQVAKLQVQQQSGTAQLAQANAAGQSVLSLLGG